MNHLLQLKTHSNSFQVDDSLVSHFVDFKDQGGQLRHIMTGITLSGDVEISGFVFLKSFQPVN